MAVTTAKYYNSLPNPIKHVEPGTFDRFDGAINIQFLESLVNDEEEFGKSLEAEFLHPDLLNEEQERLELLQHPESDLGDIKRAVTDLSVRMQKQEEQLEEQQEQVRELQKHVQEQEEEINTLKDAQNISAENIQLLRRRSRQQQNSLNNLKRDIETGKLAGAGILLVFICIGMGLYAFRKPIKERVKKTVIFWERDRWQKVYQAVIDSNSSKKWKELAKQKQIQLARGELDQEVWVGLEKRVRQTISKAKKDATYGAASQFLNGIEANCIQDLSRGKNILGNTGTLLVTGVGRKYLEHKKNPADFESRIQAARKKKFGYTP